MCRAFLIRNLVFSLARRPFHVPSAKQVQVEVANSLAALFAGIDNDPVASVQLLLPGDLSRNSYQVTHQSCILGRRFRGRTDMPLWNDECMGRGLRINVGEANTEFILVDTACRNGSTDNFAEQTIGRSWCASYQFQ